MADKLSQVFARNLRNARQTAGLTQSALAKVAKVPRLRIVRAEAGTSILKLDEVIRIARVLKVSLEMLTAGRPRSGSDLRGIAFDLFRLGLRDIEVAEPHVPGEFRLPEQVIAAALKGDSPEPRVVEAIPAILARRPVSVPLTLAFADWYDPRVRTRLAWLSDITLTLGQLSTFPTEVKTEAQLRGFIRAAVRPTEPDSLGHPREGQLPLLWSRWNITYAGDLADFRRRAAELESAAGPADVLQGVDE